MPESSTSTRQEQLVAGGGEADPPVLGGELDRVRQQVLEDLIQPDRVGPYRRAVGHGDLDPHATPGLGRPGPGHVREQVGDGHRL